VTEEDSETAVAVADAVVVPRWAGSALLVVRPVTATAVVDATTTVGRVVATLSWALNKPSALGETDASEEVSSALRTRTDRASNVAVLSEPGMERWA
jgi:hypothetical protein